ncbi:MAG: type II toxin-antitoxin system VapB family antitoxin [Armatimonadota bacterium]
MRTRIEIDQDLLSQVMKLGGFSTASEAVNAALALYVAHMRHDGCRLLAGGETPSVGESGRGDRI